MSVAGTTLPASPVTTPAAPGTGGAPVTPTPTPPQGGTVTTPSAREVELERQLAAERADAEAWRNAKPIFNRQADAGTQNEALSKTLRTAGWAEADIAAYIQRESGETSAPEAPPAGTPAPAQGGTVKGAMAAAEEAKKDAGRALVYQAEGLMMATLADLGSTVPEYAQAMKMIEENAGKPGVENASKVFNEEIRRLAAASLTQRAKDRGGEFNPNWTVDAVKEAAKVVVRKHQWGIGDPNRVGRTPETGTGDPFAGRAPIKPPVFDPKTSDGLDQSVEAWLQDSLGRLGTKLQGPVGATRA